VSYFALAVSSAHKQRGGPGRSVSCVTPFDVFRVPIGNIGLRKLPAPESGAFQFIQHKPPSAFSADSSTPTNHRTLLYEKWIVRSLEVPLGVRSKPNAFARMRCTRLTSIAASGAQCCGYSGRCAVWVSSCPASCDQLAPHVSSLIGGGADGPVAQPSSILHEILLRNPPSPLAHRGVGSTTPVGVRSSGLSWPESLSKISWPGSRSRRKPNREFPAFQTSPAVADSQKQTPLRCRPIAISTPVLLPEMLILPADYALLFMVMTRGSTCFRLVFPYIICALTSRSTYTAAPEPRKLQLFQQIGKVVVNRRVGMSPRPFPILASYDCQHLFRGRSSCPLPCPFAPNIEAFSYLVGCHFSGWEHYTTCCISVSHSV